MKVEVSEDGSIKIDGKKTEISELTQQFLEDLVDDSLASKVTYVIEGTKPIAEFFRALYEGTKEGSELRVLKEEAEEIAAATVETSDELKDDGVAD